MTRALVVWQWSDGKPGHERQCQGLVEALARRVPLDLHVLPARRSAFKRLLAYLRGALPDLGSLPAPDLILGAGRTCALPVLTARRARGGRAICIMRPQLLQTSFDLCVIPRHDGVAPTAKVVVSEGPMNPMQPAATREAGLGVLLLGGPSAHHTWQDEALLAQLRQLLGARPHLHWVVTDSRRTPATFTARLAAFDGIEFHSHRETASAWLPALLARAEQVWVSADSVSMIYEALTAGARVGVLAVPPRRVDRISAIADDLHARGLVMSLADLDIAAGEHATVLREADRIADLILTRWPTLGARA